MRVSTARATDAPQLSSGFKRADEIEGRRWSDVDADGLAVGKQAPLLRIDRGNSGKISVDTFVGCRSVTNMDVDLRGARFNLCCSQRSWEGAPDADLGVVVEVHREGIDNIVHRLA